MDVHEVAKAEGYRVVEADLGMLDGRARREGDAWIIEVNLDRSRTNQRFSVAHELGHLKLGHDSCGGNEVAERQANVFAAELLMPLAMLKAALKDVRRLSELARLFDVSSEAMRIKLEEQRLFMQLERFD